MGSFLLKMLLEIKKSTLNYKISSQMSWIFFTGKYRPIYHGNKWYNVMIDISKFWEMLVLMNIQ